MFFRRVVAQPGLELPAWDRKVGGSNPLHPTNVRFRGAVAQLVERLACNQEATGSIPVSSTFSFARVWRSWYTHPPQERTGVSPWRFDPSYPHQRILGSLARGDGCLAVKALRCGRSIRGFESPPSPQKRTCLDSADGSAPH